MVAPLPPFVQELKLAANSEFEQKHYNKEHRRHLQV